MLKLERRLEPLEASGEPADRSGSVPNGESGSSMRISSSRCSSFSVALKKSVKCDSGSEKVVEPSPGSPAPPVAPDDANDAEGMPPVAPPLGPSGPPVVAAATALPGWAAMMEVRGRYSPPPLSSSG